MNRFEYIATLKQAMEGMPPDVIASTVTEYERRIAEESAAGKSEEEILDGLENPHAVAAQRRASIQMQAFKQHKTPINFFRLCFSLIGLLVFNAFLIVPAMLYSVLLVCGYIAALACYGGGIIATSVAIAGVNEISLNNTQTDGPIQHVQIYMKDKDDSTKINMGKGGNVAANAASSASASASANTGTSATTSTTASTNATASAAGSSTSPKSAVAVGPQGMHITDGDNTIWISDDDGENLTFDDEHHGLTIEAPGVHIYNPRYSDHVFLMTDGLGLSRAAQGMIGLGMTLAGVIGFLLCLTVSRYSILGMFRLAEMEFAVLKNA